MASIPDIRKVAMIGCGSMGGNLSLLLASNNISVSLHDPSTSAIDLVISSASSADPPISTNLLSKHTSYESLASNLGQPRVYFLSLPHGSVGDSVVDGLVEKGCLGRGDVVVDASNEHWKNTERRQEKLKGVGVFYVGCGVSGGYQAARRGPSMCPSGDQEGLEIVMPLLEVIAAKDAEGRACVGRCGKGGSGHYVKMIHNGIEHGMMSAQAEAWQIMENGLGMNYDEIADVFRKWNEEGELTNTFLIEIGAEICKQRDSQGHHVLSDVEDKVVQDIDGSEGTGVWSSEEAIRLHVPAPTLSDAHYVRVASAFRQDRKRVNEAFGGHFAHAAWMKGEDRNGEKEMWLEELRKALYCAFLCAFVQGMHIIDLADRENEWNIDYAAVCQIWRNGCIIRSEHINELLTAIYMLSDVDKDLLHHDSITKELKATFPSLRKIVAKAVETNAIVPAMAGSLEWLKYSTDTVLPTRFYEAQLDFFGKHMFDVKGEETGRAETGKHHFEWRPA